MNFDAWLKSVPSSWYFHGRFVLREEAVEHRMRLLTQVIRLLLTMIPQQREVSLREASIPYVVHPDETEPFNREELQKLIGDVPAS